MKYKGVREVRQGQLSPEGSHLRTGGEIHKATMQHGMRNLHALVLLTDPGVPN